jgi:hypothetical protein
MKNILGAVLLIAISGVAVADCKTYISHGQYKQACGSANKLNNEEAIEYSEVSRAGLIRSDEATRTQLQHNPNEHSYLAQLQPNPQPAQIRQLVEYATSQGCQWEQTQHRALLICPK